MACKTKMRKPARRKMSAGGILTSTVSGAATGAVAGGIGAIPGALIGLGTGIMSHIQEQKQEEEQKNMLAAQNAYSKQSYRTSPYAQLYPNGGMAIANAELEKGEAFMTPDGKLYNLPTTAPTHAQGGVAMNLPEGTRILGKKPMDNGKQFKEAGRKLSRMQSKYLKSLENNPTSIATNTAKHMLRNIQDEFDNLYKEQGVDVNQHVMPDGTTMNNSDMQEYAKGGKIYIKPENRGKFNALKKRTGKSTEELTHSKNPLTRKRAIFAQNAKKWKHPDGGVVPGSVTTERGVSTPYYRPLTATEFQQQLSRKGVLTGDLSTMPVDSINSTIQKAYGIEDGFALPYRAYVNEQGNIVYEKDYGRNKGEYYSEEEPGKVIGGYNLPRETYPNGGVIGAYSIEENSNSRPYTNRNVYSQYSDPNTGKTFYSVKATDANISNPNVFKIGDVYGTYLSPNGGNTGNIVYDPSMVVTYGDNGEQRILYPTGYEKYVSKFSKGGYVPKYDEPSVLNGYNMSVPYSFGSEPLYTAPSVQQYQVNEATSPSTSTPDQIINPVLGSFDFNKGKLGNALSTAASLAPVAYNLIQGAKGSEQLNYKDYINPYNDYIRSLMSDRRYNVNPELEQNRLNQSTYYRNLREAAPSQGQLLGGMQAGSIQKQRADAEAIARKQNMDNQYKAEQAQMDYQLGSNIASTRMGIKDINSRSAANARSMTATGLSQLSQFAQNKQMMHNQIIRDAQRMGVLDDLVANYTFKNGDWTFKSTGQKQDPEEVLRYIKGY